MDSEHNDGGPAFPFGQVGELTGQPINGFFAPGMTLRDWFAGQALAGALANSSIDCSTEDCAKIAYGHADAMLAERRKNSS